MFFVTKARHEREIADYIRDLDESEHDVEHYRKCWVEEQKKVQNLEREMENLRHQHREQMQVSTGMLNNANKTLTEAIQLKRENRALRQILTDITGKTPEELIAAHERAIRLLEYGVEMPRSQEEAEK